ncbi:MAG: phage baseplate assembly protein V [Candidatus Deferrimicrobiaceae bacterium]
MGGRLSDSNFRSISVSRRYFGPYRGVVMNIEDPEGLMRIKALVPDVLGEQETTWAAPCVPPGVRSVPEVGTRVCGTAPFFGPIFGLKNSLLHGPG